jgi:hypothetical protein
MAIGLKKLPAIFVLSVALSLVGHNALAAERKPAKIPVFEVPTTGKIMDIQYRPEFDEWWVKCREGNDIVIYSYDKIARKWGKVVFTTKKPGEKGKQAEGAQGSVIGHPTSETGVGATREQNKPDGSKAEASEKQTDSGRKKSDKKKWWDPLNIIQGGERLIHPGTPPPTK